MIVVPGLALAIRQRARRAARAGDWAGAVRIYRRMAALGIGGVRDRIQLAHALKGSGDIPAAETAYRAAAAAWPLAIDAQRQLGLFLRHHGSAEEAVDVLARALALAPGSNDIRRELGELGFAEAAIDERMIAGLLGGTAPAFLGDRIRSHRHAARARALLARGDAPRAVAACRQALLRAPRDPAGYVCLGEALVAAGDRRAGMQAYLAAWRLQPGLPAAAGPLHMLGWSAEALARITRRGWGHADPAAPEGLGERERAIWAILAHGVGYGD